MTETPCKSLDRRVLRTRQLLQEALENLLRTREFEALSVQDIAEAATVNRATFYDHYPDKFALLECMVAGQFHGLLEARGVRFDGTCASALRAIVLGMCDFLVGMPALECERRPQLEPHLESAVIRVVRTMILDGLKQHCAPTRVSPEMVAATASWAIYGGVKEWFRTPGRCSSEEAAGTVLMLVAPILSALQPERPPAESAAAAT